MFTTSIIQICQLVSTNLLKETLWGPKPVDAISFTELSKMILKMANIYFLLVVRCSCFNK